MMRKLSVIERFLATTFPSWKEGEWDKLEASEAFRDQHEFDMKVEAYLAKYPHRRKTSGTAKVAGTQ